VDFSDALADQPGGCVITLEVSANARRDRFPDGCNPWRCAVGCAITAPPLEGRANRAILALVARTLGAKKGEVELLSGASSSIKRVLVRGTSAAAVADILAAGQD
jgi:uncharacterized protein (TIGR00251 family)